MYSMKNRLGVIRSSFLSICGALTLSACSTETSNVALAYLVSESQAIGSVSLFGTTLAVVGGMSYFPDAISAAAFPPPCLGAPATSTARMSVQQACTLNADGSTACQILTDVNDCPAMSGSVAHAPVVFVVGAEGGATMTLNMNKFTQGDIETDGSAIEFEGTVFVTTTTSTLQFAEAETITVKTAGSTDDTVLDVKSDFTVTIAADTLTVTGGGLYAVGSVGANNVTVSDLVFPLDPEDCRGPTSGSLKADTLFGTSAIEGFQIIFNACDDATLVRFKNESETERKPIDAVTAAGMFELTYDAIRSIARIPANAVPAATAPFDADAEVDASSAPDMWCRFLAEDDEPAVGGLDTDPSNSSLGVAECLIFSADVSLATDAATTDRSFLAAVFSLEGSLANDDDLIILGAQAGSHGWTASDSKLAPVLLLELDVTSATVTRKDFQTEAAAAITSLAAQLSSPFIEEILDLGGNAAPNFDCILETYPSTIELMTAYGSSVTDIEKPIGQCAPSFPAGVPPNAFSVSFTRLGMWLSGNDGSKGLYTRVVE